MYNGVIFSHTFHLIIYNASDEYISTPRNNKSPVNYNQHITKSSFKLRFVDNDKSAF